ncbi:MAG: hypothetical protein NUV75_09045 [Gallionella sp.]|nr:hypothetical protein [Gallionella sp.]
MEDSVVKQPNRFRANKRPDLIPAFDDARVTAVWTDEFWAWNTYPNYGLSVIMVDAHGETIRRAVRHGLGKQDEAIAELKEWLGTV